MTSYPYISGFFKAIFPRISAPLWLNLSSLFSSNIGLEIISDSQK